MPSHHVRALSLKKTKLGESDVIVTLLAEDGCQLRAVAKGARKPGSRLGGRVEPFTVLDLLLHTGRTLEVVSEAEIVTSHSAVREDYDRSMAASVMADFLDKVSVECQTEDRLFGLACATLDALDDASGDTPLALLVAFLVKGMAMQGYRPQFDACASCGVSAASSSCFSLESGGPLCEGCEAGAADAVVLTAAARGVLCDLLRVRMSEVGGLGIPREALQDAFSLLRAFVAYHVPARLKALAMYASQVGSGPSR